MADTNQDGAGADFDLTQFYQIFFEEAGENLDQMEQMKNMGPIQNVLGMIPGINSKVLKNAQVDEKKMAHIEAIIKSMTPNERELKDKLTPSRKERVAKGSGVSIVEVNSLLKQFDQMQKMMKKVAGKGGMAKMMRAMGGMKGLMGKGGFPKF